MHTASSRFLDDKNVANVTASQDTRDRIDNMMESLNYIVLFIILCAGALAFIVIYNLTNININERIREIATIKVLGFYPMESAMYVYRENMVMTVLGALVGLGLGKLLHAFVVSKINVDMMAFDAQMCIRDSC